MGFTQLGCCGIKEYYDLGININSKGVEKVVEEIANQTRPAPPGGVNYGDRLNHQYPCAFILFSAVRSGKYGSTLHAFIHENKLGEVWETEFKKNPNSNNLIKVYIWGIDRKALDKWSAAG